MEKLRTIENNVLSIFSESRLDCTVTLKTGVSYLNTFSVIRISNCRVRVWITEKFKLEQFDQSESI